MRIEILLLTYCSFTRANLHWDELPQEFSSGESSLPDFTTSSDILRRQAQTPQNCFESKSHGDGAMKGLEMQPTSPQTDRSSIPDDTQRNVVMEQDLRELSAMHKELDKQLQRLQAEADEALERRPWSNSDLGRLMGEKNLELLLRESSDDATLRRQLDEIARLYKQMVHLLLELMKMGPKLPLTLMSQSHAVDSENESETVTTLDHDVVGIILQKSFKHAGNEFVTELMQFLIRRGSFSPKFKEISILRSKFAFKIIHFLLKHEYADLETFRSMFQNPEMTRHVVKYADLVFKTEVQSTLSHENIELTRHWYWPFLDNSFKALSEEEKNMINSVALLEHQYNAIRARTGKRNTNHLLVIFNELFTFFDPPKYLDHLRKRNRLAKESSKQNASRTSTDEWIIHDITKLFQLFAKAHNLSLPSTNRKGIRKKFLMTYLLDLVRWIDEFASPGVIRSIVQEPTLFESVVSQDPIVEFSVKCFDLLKAADRIEGIYKNASLHLAYLKRNHPFMSFESRLHKPMFESYYIEFCGLLDQLQLQTDENRTKLVPSSPLWYDFQKKILKLQTWKGKLQKMKEVFPIQ